MPVVVLPDVSGGGERLLVVTVDGDDAAPARYRDALGMRQHGAYTVPNGGLQFTMFEELAD